MPSTTPSKKKKKQAIRQKEAVLLPHDGPIHYDREMIQQNILPAVTPITVLQAVNLLSDSQAVLIDKAKNTNLLHQIHLLLSQLQKSDLIQNQLGALQNAKTAFSQQKSQVVICVEEIAALYRILLEWSGSFQTPMPLRKSVHGLMDTIWKAYYDTIVVEKNQETHVLQNVFVEVLESIVGAQHQKMISPSVVWKKPVHTLDVMLAMALIHDHTTSQMEKAKKKNEEMEATPSYPTFLQLVLGKIWTYLKKISRDLIPRLEQVTAHHTTNPLISQIGRTGEVLDSEIVMEQSLKIAGLVKTLLETIQDPNVKAADSLERPGASCRTTLSQLTWTLLACPTTPSESLVVISMSHGQLLGMSGDSSESRASWQSSLRTPQEGHQSMPELPRVVWLQGLLAAAATEEDLFGSMDNEQGIPLVNVFMENLVSLVSTAVNPDVRLAAIKGLRTLTHRCATWMTQAESSNRKHRVSMLHPIVDDILECVLAAWENPASRKISNSIPPLFEACLDLSFVLSREEEDTREDEQPQVPQSLVQRFLAQPANRKGRYKALELLLPRVGAKRLLYAGQRDGDPVLSDESLLNSRLLGDLVSGIAEISSNTGAIADLWAKLLDGLLKEVEEDYTEMVGTLPQIWIDAWVPSLTQSLIEPVDSKRRKQVASFCIPRSKFLCGEDRRQTMGEVFGALIDHVHLKAQPQSEALAKTVSREHETFWDRKLWASCEIIRLAAAERLFDDKIVRHLTLEKSVKCAMSTDHLQSALLHFSPTIRSVAFQAMGPIIHTYEDRTPYEESLAEIQAWKKHLPFSLKTESRDCMTSILHCLVTFLDKLSSIESSIVPGKDVSETSMYDFVGDFLLSNLFARKAAYPGTVLAKESFALALLECIIVFTCRELDIAQESKLLPKAGRVFERKRGDSEEKVFSAIRQRLLSREVVDNLISLLQSSWDSTRSSSFSMLSSLLMMSRQYNLPSFASFRERRPMTETKSFHLVASPRQREADTGARELALFCLSKATFLERMQYLRKLLTILQRRIEEMKHALEAILTDTDNAFHGQDIPLAHGIIHTIQLAMASKTLVGRGDTIPQDFLSSLTKTMVRALQISLSVVADLKEGEQLEAASDVLGENVSTTGKINPGAIGANGIFGSLDDLDETELRKRLASQRLIMAFWLLLKDSSAGLAASLVFDPSPEDRVVNQAGILFINTLTSLKHTGAAFAAHNAFQQLSQLAMKHMHLQHLPQVWTDRLEVEICQTDKVRDSTLRRSTGYGLGFLSIMRSEVLLKKPPRFLCRNVIQNILKMALPPHTFLKNFLRTAFGRENVNIFQSNMLEGEANADNSIRTRVHALNVLRMIILDAPLSSEVHQFIGDCISISIIGYLDPLWGIRNSSSLVFAACLLRVVDADKNAANSDAKSSNAITFASLSTSYPQLPAFLASVLDASISGKFNFWASIDLPPLLPILILLYRVLPSKASDQDSVTLFEPFVSLAFSSLSHRHIAVRKAASRALANMSSTNQDSPTFYGDIFQQLVVCIRKRECWNTVHGAILSLTELYRSAPLSDQKLSLFDCTDDLKDILSLTRSTTPPLCLSEALKALQELGRIKADISTILESCCFSTLAWICSKDSTTPALFGLADLASVSSTVAVELVISSLRASLQSEHDEFFGKLSCLIECSHIDARIAAVKAIKKQIYGLVDNVIAFAEEDAQKASSILLALGKTLQSGLEEELSREDGSIGPHSPSLRRLSRCLLECVDGVKKLNPNETGLRITLFAVDQALSNAQVFANIESRKFDENTAHLVGNALEIKALSIPCQVEQVAKAATELSNPSLSWRLRYSSSVAMKAVLKSSEISDCQLSLWDSGIKLLQDADDDVRYVASLALSPGASATQVSTVAEFTLLQMSKTNLSRSNSSLALMSLVSSLDAIGLKAKHKLKMLIAELSECLQSGIVPESIANSGTDRKIFEVEEANSYGEICLDVQVAVAMVVTSELTVNDSLIDQCSTLLETCRETVGILMDCPTSILHHATRAGTLFPLLHSFFLGCACLTKIGMPVEDSLKHEISRLVLNMDSDCHLLFQTCSSALSDALKGSPEAASILESCFLLEN